MKYTLTLLITLLLAACNHSIQTTSGRAYIADSPGTIDADIAEIAAVEPNLRFPARIGIARIVNGNLTLPPTEEITLFNSLLENNTGYGEFVPVSPLVLAMTQGEATTINQNLHRRAADVTRNIRRASALQHLDYVIIYEIGARSRTANTPFALADVTLLGGMLLPTRNIDVAGVGAAAFIDVRNGYPYGTTQVAADLSGFARTFQAGIRSEELRAEAALKVAEKLLPEIEEMLVALKREAQS